MFRKALDIQGDKKYSGKDIKKLNALLVLKFGEKAAFGARADVFVKAEASGVQLITVKGEDGTEFCFGALDAKALDRGITAAANGERGKVADIDAAVLFPTLHRLWKACEDVEGCPSVTEEMPPVLQTPPVLVHPDVTHFLLKGADLMAPGLQGRQYPYPEGAIVAVYARGNPKPVAVGQWQGNRSSGVAVKIFTCFGDMLWGQNPEKPQGFTPTCVMSLESSDDTGASGGGGAAAERNGASDTGVAGAEAADLQATADEDKAAAEPSPQIATDPTAEMDALLMQAFLQAAKTSLKQDGKNGTLKVGPLAPDIFYSQYVRPARPANSSIDVHKSSYKKVAKFLSFLKDEELISVDKNGHVSGINRSSPSIREFELHEVADASAGGSSGGAGRGQSLFVEGVASCSVIYPLYLVNAELNKIFASSDGACVSPHVRPSSSFRPPPRESSDGSETNNIDGLDVFVEKSLVASALKDYCSRLDVMVSKKLVDVKRLGIPLLAKDEHGDEAKPVTVDALARRVLESGTGKHTFHKVTSVSLLGEEKISFRQGAPQRVDIRTEKRKNHNVTILQGLDARCYGFDLEKLADFFKKKFSVATFLEEMGSAKMIVVGGFFDRDLEQMLTKDLAIPADCVENLAADRKAGMKQGKK
eukprot:TRINITY_DN22628_c0_g3_i1.p1 TRINITY_DN22628_c0_g3~~TRINITY_DN22628_c0_g3_i1.p1  ORF type:complete len:646 (+),score=102.95 TRINITY_DN22628_c0_g3_i1:85-2022(+)